MHQDLPVSVFIKSISWGSSESEFGASVNSTLAWASEEKSPSGSWVNSYLSSANDISICNAVKVN